MTMIIFTQDFKELKLTIAKNSVCYCGYIEGPADFVRTALDTENEITYPYSGDPMDANEKYPFENESVPGCAVVGWDYAHAYNQNYAKDEVIMDCMKDFVKVIAQYEQYLDQDADVLEYKQECIVRDAEMMGLEIDILTYEPEMVE